MVFPFLEPQLVRRGNVHKSNRFREKTINLSELLTSKQHLILLAK